MIIICEPQCKGISHEQVNSAFIYGLRLAYPQEKIVFFSDANYFLTLEKKWKNNDIVVDNFEHLPINFKTNKMYSIGGIINYFFLFKKIFNKILSLNSDKIFLLSSNPIILYVIKKLKQSDRFKDIFCTFVLHGELEDIANVEYLEPYVPVIYDENIIPGFKNKFIKAIKNPKRIVPYFLEKIYASYALFFKKIFRMKKMLLWQHSNHYKYIALSPHIVKNAKKYLDTDYLNFQVIIMPTIFAKNSHFIGGDFVKFAVFGYGDSAQMKKMLTLLSTKKISKQYEIRIISMDNRGTQGFKNVNCLSNGKVLDRQEMEKSTQDIDMFINLYDSTRHRFGCSGSIFEAFSYLKPILHLSNDGYNYFNKLEKPIGFRCENMENFVDKMQDIIDNYSLYKKQLEVFRNNMLEYRNEYAIENNLDKLRESFSFYR